MKEERPFIPFIRTYLVLLIVMVSLSVALSYILSFIATSVTAHSPEAFGQFVTTMEEFSRSFIDLLEVTVGSIIGALAVSTQLSAAGSSGEKKEGQKRGYLVFHPRFLMGYAYYRSCRDVGIRNFCQCCD